MVKIAVKSTFMIGIRIGVIILVILFLLFPTENIVIIYLQYMMIIYGIYNLVKLIMQLLQPKILIIQEEDYLVIRGIIKHIKINMQNIATIIAQQSKTRGVIHEYGTLVIVLLDGQKFKVSNVDKVADVKSNIIQLKNLQK